jgi:hypothetical protein
MKELRATRAPDSITAAKTPADEADRVAFRTGLAAFLRGEHARSIATFEAALTRGATGGFAADLHAYLGVAYAASALSTPIQDTANRLREQALTQFRLARQLNPAYRLSDRVVSPAIIAWFRQVPPG